MKFMKLGTKPDTFHSEEATRTVISEASSDLIIEINNTTYLLHKLQYQLVPKSGLLQQLCSLNSENSKLELHEIPGGEEAFEVCSKFCYGITINLSAHNIVASLCAAKFLHMTEAVHKGNLARKLDTFFSMCILQGWKDSVLALRTTSKLPEWSASLGIIRSCIDSIVDKTLTPPAEVTWSYTYTRPGYKQKNREFVPKDWWTEDVSDLDIDMFRYVIAAVESRKILQPQLIGEALHVYIFRWLRDSFITSKEAQGSSSAGSQSENKETKRRIIETVVSMIPSDKGSVSIGFLLRLLQLAKVVGASRVTKADLLRRSSQKLEEATVNDLLLLSSHQSAHSDRDTQYLYDVELVEAVLESFVLQWRRQHALSSIQKIGELIDSYLQVVATDINMPVVKFVSLVKALPEIARPDHDDLYMAIHIYLREHPDMGKAEKKQLCSILDSRKLSVQVREQAVRNEQLPLRIVVQLLLFDHAEMKGSKTSTIAPPQINFEKRRVSDEVNKGGHTLRSYHKPAKMQEIKGMITQEGSSSTILDDTKKKSVMNTR